METKIIERAELWRIGHYALLKVLPPDKDTVPQLTIEQALGVGILATLLRIADDQSKTGDALQAIAKDLSKLVTIQNMARLVEEL